MSGKRISDKVRRGSSCKLKDDDDDDDDIGDDGHDDEGDDDDDGGGLDLKRIKM